MWVVQHVDVTWVSHTLKHGNVVSIAWQVELLQQGLETSATWW
jgi:hypothetical protein